MFYPKEVSSLVFCGFALTWYFAAGSCEGIWNKPWILLADTWDKRTNMPKGRGLDFSVSHWGEKGLVICNSLRRSCGSKMLFIVPCIASECLSWSQVVVALGSRLLFLDPLATHYTLHLLLSAGLDVCGLRLIYPSKELLAHSAGK